MDERASGHTTTFTRAARTRRMLDRLSEGCGYSDVARAEGLSDRRVRQIVAGHVKRSAPVDADAHAALQIERLGFAVKVAGEALAKGDIRAIAPFIKAIDRLDAYQTRAPKAAPRRSQAADALVVKALVDRLKGVVRSEAAASAVSPDPAAAPAPAIEARPSAPPTAFTHLQSARGPLPQLAGEGGAKRRMGCGPPLQPEPDCAIVTASLRPTIPAFPTPSGLRPPSPLRGEGETCAAAAPPVPLAEPAPPPVPLAEPRPPLAGAESPLDIAAPPAVEAQLAPPAPAPVAPPFARPNLSNFAMSNFSPFFWR